MRDTGVFSVLGLFDSAPLLMQAIPEVRSKVKARLEAYSPFPIHGIEKALGLRKSPIAGMVLIMGIIGAISGIGFELWTSGKDTKTAKFTANELFKDLKIRAVSVAEAGK